MAEGHRLYVKGKHISFQRGKKTQNPNTSLIMIEGVDNPKAASFYLGKRIAYVYRGKREVRGTKIRVIWGKVTRTHGKDIRNWRTLEGYGSWIYRAAWLTYVPGNSGVVRAQFRHNLPPKSLGAMVRIMLYPSAI
ncbi:60S ribosomal protein L33B [Vermiconidia calcicola]|uniref:60S ribosomal protein L33B n=1 Tax=Vermiconidia calcicola TaxID=1690605 RepID=A0ACC3NEP4_9PEZI|nr:60S ribosomal protein L33B [Vermiconidia calcicola]